jgi:hypothetical protein
MPTRIVVIEPNTSPLNATNTLRAMLAANGVTGYEVALKHVCGEGYFFRVSAEPTFANEQVFAELFAEAEPQQTLQWASGDVPVVPALPGGWTFSGTPQVEPDKPLKKWSRITVGLAGVDDGWQLVGDEGRFAVEHPPPSWAK